MSPHKKRKVLRWSVRVVLLIVLLPVAALVLIRYAGWFDMRRTDREIKAYLMPHRIHVSIDTTVIAGRSVVWVKASAAEARASALIFVHGSPGSLDAALDYMADTALLAQVDVIAYDRPGYGHSGYGLSMPSLLRQAEVLNALMDSLGYASYYLAGHSYGAPILVKAAMRRPGRVKGICLIAGSVSPELEPRSTAWRKWIDLPLVRDMIPVTMRVSNEELMPLRHDLAIMEDDWDRLTMPAVILHGTKDVLVPYANLDYAREKLVHADTVYTRTFEGESHFIFWTHKDEVVKEIVRVMERGGG